MRRAGRDTTQRPLEQVSGIAERCDGDEPAYIPGIGIGNGAPLTLSKPCAYSAFMT